MQQQPPGMRLKCVLYRDEEREPVVLPAMAAPASVTALRSLLEKATEHTVKLISFWSYRHSRYEPLLAVDQLAQKEALLATSSSLTASGATAAPSQQQSDGSGDATAERRSGPLYRAQLWLESSFQLLEQVDPVANKEEFHELAQHVRRFAGNRHVSYELIRAARLRYGYLSRMFDRTRQERLHASGDSVRLLFYANNAWSTTDVMRYGFLVRDSVPTGLDDSLRTGVAGFGQRSPSLADLTGGATSTTHSDGLARSPHVTCNEDASPGLVSQQRRDGRAHSLENTRKHPFTFTSSMVNPRDRRPPLKGPQKVLLCEVSQGRAWVVDEPITTLTAHAGPAPPGEDALERPPEGYDAVVYEEEKADGAHDGARRGPPSKHSPEKRCQPEAHAPLTQVMVAQSHQALPRYLLTIAPAKPEEAPGLLRSIFSSASRRKAKDGAGDATSPAPRVTDDSVRSLSRASASPTRFANRPESPPRLVTPQQQRQALSQTPTPERAPRPLSAASRSRSPNGQERTAYLPMYSSRLRGSQLALQTPERQPTPQRPQQQLSQPRHQQHQQPLRQQLQPNLIPPEEDVAEVGTSAPHAPHRSSQVQSHAVGTPSRTLPDSSHSQRSITHGDAPLVTVATGGVAEPSPNASGVQPPPPVGPRQRTVPPIHGALLPPPRSGSASPVRPPMQRSQRGSLSGLSPASTSPRAVPAPSPLRSALAIPQALRCPAHPSNLMNIYCVTCRALTCPYCASVGSHKSHEVEEADAHAGAVRREMQSLCDNLSHWLGHFTRVQRQLEAETGEAQAQQARRVQTLRGQLAEVRRALDGRERLLLKHLADPGELLRPPVAEAETVRAKYAAALQPLEACLRAHQAGQSTQPDSPGQSGDHISPRAQVSTLQFLRAAPQLMAEAEAFLRGRDKQEETRLKAAIATVRAANQRADEVVSAVDTSALRQEVELLGTNARTVHVQEKLLLKSNHSSAPRRGGASRSPTRSSRQRHRTPGDTAATTSQMHDWSMATSPTRGMEPRGSITGSPPRRCAGTGAAEERGGMLDGPVSLALVERCLLDLQRGHIWAIQGASRFFCVGQTKAVCSTPFRLKGMDWELRIATMPGGGAEEQGRGVLLLTPPAPTSPAAGVSTTNRPVPQFVRLPGQGPTPAVGPDGSVLSPVPSGGACGANGPPPLPPPDGAPSPTRFQPRLMGQSPGVADEDQWLGIFLFPVGHRQRLDFRVIAFSEVSWTEWKVVGWTDEFAGKGWGLYPFLRRRDLMRLDKLARDNIVKICVTPISDLY